MDLMCLGGVNPFGLDPSVDFWVRAFAVAFLFMDAL